MALPGLDFTVCKELAHPLLAGRAQTPNLYSATVHVFWLDFVYAKTSLNWYSLILIKGLKLGVMAYTGRVV